MNDPIGDMITRIRNGLMVGKETVSSPASRLRAGVLDVLKSEGFIRGYSEREVRKGIKALDIELKYYEGQPVIREIARASRPGRRDYAGTNGFMPVHNGLGISIVSTSKGVLSDKQAKSENVGGEVLCTVF